MKIQIKLTNNSSNSGDTVNIEQIIGTIFLETDNYQIAVDVDELKKSSYCT